MKRKDGRELVTEHPVTAMDRIEYLGRVELSEESLTCQRMRRDPDDFDIGEWDA